jgi:hypothetical protein
VIRAPVPCRNSRFLPLAILACFLSPVPAAEEQPAIWVPDTEAEDAPLIDDTTWLNHGPLYSIRLTRIGTEARRAYIRKVIGSETDPFASPPDSVKKYFSFLLQIENRGEGAIMFNPMHCWLMTNKKEIQTPVGLSDLSFLFKVVDQQFPPAYDKIAPLLLDEPRMVEPGEMIHGMLVYKPFKKPKTKAFNVDVQLSLPSGDVVRLSAPYRRLTKNEMKEQP